MSFVTYLIPIGLGAVALVLLAGVQYVARWQRQHLTKAHALACRITICHHYCGHAQPLHCRPIGV